MFTISKRYAFSASHVLNGLPANHPCGRLHGHNYEVEAIVAADEVDERGFVIDYHEVDAVMKPLIEAFDHRHINEVIDVQPSAENLAHEFWVSLTEGLAGAARVVAIRVSETPKTWAEFRP